MKMYKKVCEIGDTFNKTGFCLTKVGEIVETYDKVILKVTKTHGFLKVTGRKCDRGVVLWIWVWGWVPPRAQGMWARVF